MIDEIDETELWLRQQIADRAHAAWLEKVKSALRLLEEKAARNSHITQLEGARGIIKLAHTRLDGAGVAPHLLLPHRIGVLRDERDEALAEVKRLEAEVALAHAALNATGIAPRSNLAARIQNLGAKRDEMWAEAARLKAAEKQWESEWNTISEANAAGYNQAKAEIAAAPTPPAAK
jgi:hypothetical protein